MRTTADRQILSRRAVLIAAAPIALSGLVGVGRSKVLNATELGVAPGSGEDQSLAIQAALDACRAHGGGCVVLPSGSFLLAARPQTGPAGLGSISLTMRDGVSLKGAGAGTVLRALPKSYGIGAFQRMLGTAPDEPVSQMSVSDLTLDGDRASQIKSQQASNLLLECGSNVTVARVSSINANGNALMLRGTPGRPAHNIRVMQCVVRDASYIGIQASQFVGCEITNNNIDRTADNAIDIYGEDGTIVASASNFLIARNHIACSTIGVFVETCRDGRVEENIVLACSAIGVAVNRINGEPRGIIVTKNDLSAPVGARVTGDTGGVFITDNLFRHFSDAAVMLGGDSGNVSHVTVNTNRYHPDNKQAVFIRAAGRQAAFLRAYGNVQNGGVRMLREIDISANVVVDAILR